jgi:hypothetical protein
MSIGRGTQGLFGYVKSGLLGVHRDPTKWIALKEPPTITADIAQIDSRMFAPGAYHQSMERMQGTHNFSGSFVMSLHPEEGIEFLKGALGTVTSTELTGTGSGIYEHEFVGGNTVPMTEGFSLTISADLIVKYLSGVVVTSIEIGAEVDGEVVATVNFVAKKMESAAAGTQATSQGQNAISFPCTLVVSTSDQIKLAIDAGSAVEVTIAAGAYATAAALEAAVNTAINGTAGLLDSDGLPECACHITGGKINFYTADKGAGAAIAWTAGTADAGTLLGRGTPVQAAGTAALTTPSYSSVQPFMATQMTVKQDTAAIGVSSFKLSIDPKIVPRKVLGSKYFLEPKLDGKREIALSLTKEYEGEAAITAWLANSDVEFEANLRTATEIVAASGVTYDADIYIKKVRINNSPEPKFNSQGALTQEISARLYYEDATYKDLKIDVNNTIAAI